jgi:hypothetical protein
MPERQMTATKQHETRRASGPKPGGAVPRAPESAPRARLERPQELWGRRSVAIGVLLVAAALIGGLVLLISGAGDDNGGSSSAGAPTPRTQDLQDRFLKHTVALPDDGISVRRPGNWTDAKNNGVITLRSHDRCVAVNLSAPAGAKGAKGLRTDSVSAVRQGYENVQVSPAGHAPVGGIPTTSSAIRLTDSNGDRRRILLSVGTGKKNAYLSEVVLGNPSCQVDLALAQVVMGSAQFSK